MYLYIFLLKRYLILFFWDIDLGIEYSHVFRIRSILVILRKKKREKKKDLVVLGHFSG